MSCERCGQILEYCLQDICSEQLCTRCDVHCESCAIRSRYQQALFKPIPNQTIRFATRIQIIPFVSDVVIQNATIGTGATIYTRKPRISANIDQPIWEFR